tara:strand:+ start:179 stop:310 length:132 start_codon:yes stop_codon:yes gene_type:complete
MGEEKTLVQKLKPFALPLIAVGLIINANHNSSYKLSRGFNEIT